MLPRRYVCEYILNETSPLVSSYQYQRNLHFKSHNTVRDALNDIYFCL